MNLTVLLFDDFETLDVYGPVEIFGRIRELYPIRFGSLAGGLVKNNHGVKAFSEKLEDLISDTGIFLVPGGYGTRKEVHNEALLRAIREISEKSQYVLSICTGAALLARAGLLDGRKATSNKRAFDWVTSQGEKVEWIKKARWTKDGKFYCSAGVSAGMDMSLGFLQDLHGRDFARQLAFEIEYYWTEDMHEDEFYEQ